MASLMQNNLLLTSKAIFINKKLTKNVLQDPKGSIRHANLRQLKDRLNAVGTVKKISQVMKILTQQRIAAVQQQLFKTRDSIIGSKKVWDEIPVEHKGKKNLFVVLSTDKGMCGGINAQTYRFTRDLIKDRVENLNITPSIISIGELCSKPLLRFFPNAMTWQASQFSKKGASFVVASHLADRILQSDADTMTLIYNEYINQMAYEIQARDFIMPKGLDDVKTSFWHYEFADGQNGTHTRDLHEYSLATFLYQAMVENSASESSARLVAMDGASKNATELAKTIQRLYNKKRQGAITTELLELVAGAMFTSK